jgi:hypothetical protein
MKLKLLYLLIVTMLCAACGTQEIPPAHKGRLFEKTGALAFYGGAKGFSGPILGPGTQYTGVYNEVRMVDCGQRTIKELLPAQTKDSVQYGIDVYVRFGANCDATTSVESLLSIMSPANAPALSDEEKKAAAKDENLDPVEPFPSETITSRQIYQTYIRPALGESAREAASQYTANDMNSNRDALFAKISANFNEQMKKAVAGKDSIPLVTIYNVNLSNLHPPANLEKANADKAEQAVLKDKAIAELEKVKSEVKTAEEKINLERTNGLSEAAWIDAVGAAYKRNPEYTTYAIYKTMAEKGNAVIAPNDPHMMLNIMRR